MFMFATSCERTGMHQSLQCGREDQGVRCGGGAQPPSHHLRRCAGTIGRCAGGQAARGDAAGAGEAAVCL